MKIGLDLDGVVYDFQSTFIHMVNYEFGVEFPPGLDWWDSWDSADAYMTQEQIDWIWSNGVRKGLFRHGHLLKGAHDGAQKLAVAGTVELVTHRPAAAMRDTIAWLNHHFGADDPYPFSGVHLLTNGEPKSSVPGINVYIDDGAHIADDVIENTNSVLLLWDRPYNRDVEPGGDRLVRISSWDEAIQELERVDGRLR